MIIAGIEWNVEVKGSGETIVLLHGWGQNQYMMKFLADYFCEHFQVINMDLPGFGQSEEPKVVWNIQMYADALHELFVHFHVEKPIFIAHSFGARIALRYALCYPVQKMILTGAAGIKEKHGFSYYLRISIYKALKKINIHLNMGSNDYQNASEIMRGVLVTSVKEDMRECLPYIPCTTLLVWGEKDTTTPLWMGKLMEKEIPNATLIVLKNEDHFAYFHQSLRFVKIVEAFLYE